MISLVLPTASSNRYLFWDGIAFGPLDTNYKFQPVKVTFDSKLAAIDEKRGIYRENDVLHDKIEGDLEYHIPFLGAVHSLPRDTRPTGWKVPIYDKLYAYPRTDSRTWFMMDCSFGIASPGNVLTRWMSDKSAVEHCWFTRNPDNPHLWIFWRLAASTLQPRVIDMLTRYDMTDIKQSGTGTLSYKMTIYWKRTTYYTPVNRMTAYTWTEQQSLDVVLSEIAKLSILSTSNTTASGSQYEIRSSTGFSPQSARLQIDELVATIFPDKFPIEDMHYGDLAMEASKKVNANTVNMIAFFRDLRRPKELIPKLQNLKNLRGVSDNFLTVDFGILPTISDIEDIVKAFKNRKPFMDKNGFKVFNSENRADLEENGLTYSLEQHIKLAIANEDNEFEALIQRLESWGALPTFENVWDLVPHSFVVDWFIDVGGFLERVDTRLRLSRLNIRYVTMSRKTHAVGKFPTGPEAPFTGTVDWVQYHRWTSDQCPVPPLSLNTTFQDFDHWLESGALLAQRSR